ncbi:unnamed protein product, partial [Mesorhabditis spiculigera]
MEYKGQFDENKPVKEKKSKPNAHVKWGEDVVVEESYSKSSSDVSPPRVSVYHRISESSHASDSPTHGDRRYYTKQPGVTRHVETARRGSIEMRASPAGGGKHGYRNIAIGPKHEERIARTESRTSSSSGSPPKREWSKTSGETEVIPLLQTQQRGKRPPLRTHKSVDSTTLTDSPVLSLAPGRRRSSLGAEEHSISPIVHTTRTTAVSVTERTFRVDSPHHVVKKISITSTGNPFIV